MNDILKTSIYSAFDAGGIHFQSFHYYTKAGQTS